MVAPQAELATMRNMTPPLLSEARKLTASVASG